MSDKKPAADRDKLKPLCAPATEAEAAAFTQALAEKNIPVVLTKSAIREYPGLGELMEGSYGVLLVSGAHVNSAQAVVQDVQKQLAAQPPPKREYLTPMQKLPILGRALITSLKPALMLVLIPFWLVYECGAYIVRKIRES